LKIKRQYTTIFAQTIASLNSEESDARYKCARPVATDILNADLILEFLEISLTQEELATLISGWCNSTSSLNVNS